LASQKWILDFEILIFDNVAAIGYRRLSVKSLSFHLFFLEAIILLSAIITIGTRNENIEFKM